MSELESLLPFNPLFETSTNIFMQRESSAGTTSTLKRRASPSFEGLGEESCRKRMREDQDPVSEIAEESDSSPVVQSRLEDDLAQELQCGCCSELVYRPVIVSPCQHFFCGR